MLWTRLLGERGMHNVLLIVEITAQFRSQKCLTAMCKWDATARVLERSVYSESYQTGKLCNIPVDQQEFCQSHKHSSKFLYISQLPQLPCARSLFYAMLSIPVLARHALLRLLHGGGDRHE